MKKQLLIALTPILLSGYANAQSDKFWEVSSKGKGNVVTAKGVARESFPKDFMLFDLNSEAMRQTLFSAVNSTSKKSAVISLPNAEGGIEQFEVFEASNFDAELQAQFPEIRAFSGKGITDKYATLKISISPEGIQTMVFRVGKENEFMEPYSADRKIYAVYKSQREKGKLNWTCSVDDKKAFDDISNKIGSVQKSTAGQLKTMRLAQSCTAEYANYFGATSAAQVNLVLAAFNATLTRCNGVYEKDLGLHLNLVAQSTNVIYYNPATDPYSTTLANWNTELQNALSTSLTGPSTTLAANNAAYDIGHMFGASGGGGNAGCIGCVCVDAIAAGTGATKGRGITSPADGVPQGDNFDIDYVVHEVGHQLGANHTFSMSNEGSGVNMEVGSGVTIMGYAGITDQDVAPHSIDVYHAASIAQIQTNLAGKTCPVTTNIAANNATPVVNAGADYTIPISTPFILTGSATDANVADALTYSWEQYDNDSASQTNAASAASATKTIGPNFRSFLPSTSPVRYFPQMSSVLNGQTTTQGAEIAVEALSSVARTLNFRLTVRDNAPYSGTAPIKVGQTNFDNMVVTVDATRGPLTVTSQNVDNQSWLQNSTQTITWNVNNTNTSAGGANVDILLSTDGGLTYPTVLLANTPNDGSQTITVPNVTAQKARVMVKASGNIFFNVNLKDIAIGYNVTSTCNTYANNTSIAIPDGLGTSSPALGPVAQKTVNVPMTGNVSDVNVTLATDHTYISDLYMQLVHPDNTAVWVWYGSCTSQNGFSITFDDAAAAAPTCTGGTNAAGPTGATFKPSGMLSDFNNRPVNGNWTIAAADAWQVDTGNLTTFSLNVCTKTYTLSNPDFEFEDFNLFPNPNKGDFTIKFTSSTGSDIKIVAHDLRGRQVYEKSFTNTGAINQNVTLNNVESGIYLVSVIDGAKKTVKRVVVE